MNMFSRALIGILAIYLVFIPMYVLSYLISVGLFKYQGTVDFSTGVNLILIFIATLVAGITVVKKVDLAGVKVSVTILILLTAIDIIGGLYSFHGQPKSNWFYYIFHPIMALGLYFGALFRERYLNVRISTDKPVP